MLRFLKAPSILAVCLIAIIVGVGGATLALAQQKPSGDAHVKSAKSAAEKTTDRIKRLEEEITRREVENDAAQAEITELGRTLSKRERGTLKSFQATSAVLSGSRCGDDPELIIRDTVQNDLRVGDTFMIVRGSSKTGFSTVGKTVVIHTGQDNPEHKTVLRITDTGLGIRPEDQAYIVNRDTSPYSFSRIKFDAETP